MIGLEDLLDAFRSIDRAIELGELTVGIKEPTVMMTLGLFRLLGTDGNGKPSEKLFVNFVRNVRSYINFRRGFRIGADGEALDNAEAPQELTLLKREDALTGYILQDQPPHKPVMAFSFMNGKLEGPVRVESLESNV